MLVNGWNAAGDNNSGKSVGVSLTLVPSSKLTIIQNVVYGPEQADNADDKRTYSDTNVVLTLSPKVSAGLNYVYAKDSIGGDGINWQGVALYFKGQLTPMFALSPRFEIFDDQDGFVERRRAEPEGVHDDGRSEAPAGPHPPRRVPPRLVGHRLLHQG